LAVLRRLLADASGRRSLLDDPSGTMAANDFEGFSDDDVRSLIDHAGDAMRPDAARWLQSFGADDFVNVDPPVPLEVDGPMNVDLTALDDVDGGLDDAVEVAGLQGLAGQTEVDDVNGPDESIGRGHDDWPGELDDPIELDPPADVSADVIEEPSGFFDGDDPDWDADIDFGL
jgi:hypothetical protein